MSEIKCFMVEETGEVMIELRRFTFGDRKQCPRSSCGHDASVQIGKAQAQKDNKGCYLCLPVDKTDERFPKTCTCGYEFQDEDEWQCNQQEIYRNIETGEEHVGPTHRLPVGAMWYIDREWPWYYPSPTDGRVLAMRTPGGEWVIDGRANNGPQNAAGWSRTGVPPLVVARPSIQAGAYHGWLGGGSGDRPGYLVEC